LRLRRKREKRRPIGMSKVLIVLPLERRGVGGEILPTAISAFTTAIHGLTTATFDRSTAISAHEYIIEGISRTDHETYRFHIPHLIK